MNRKSYGATFREPRESDSALVLNLECQPGKKIKLDVGRWRYLGRPTRARISAKARSLEDEGLTHAGRDDLVEAVFETLRHMTHQTRLTTVWTYANASLSRFFEYLDHLHTHGEQISLARSIDFKIVTGFLKWLAGVAPSRRYSEGTVQTVYSGAISVFHRMADLGHLAEDSIPRSPFRGFCISRAPGRPYSTGEMQRIMSALEHDIELIRASDSTIPSRAHQLATYFAYLAAITGRNTSSLLALRRDCLVAHPLREDRALLIYDKARSAGRYSVTIDNKPSQNDERLSEAVFLSTANLVEEVKQLTDFASASAPVQLSDRLWLYVENMPRGFGTVKTLDRVDRAMSHLQRRHALRRDDGTNLVPNISLFRKTMAVALNGLNGNDVTASARAMRHTRQTHAANYAPVSGQMLRAFKYCGVAIEAFARGKLGDPQYCEEVAGRLGLSYPEAKRLISDEWNTGVGRCSSPFKGKYAPRDGTPCTKFLHCFKCPNFVVSGDRADLHRLFSFYWLLVKERDRLGPSPWKRIYRHVIRIIDEQICPQFDAETIKAAKSAALATPHAMWRPGALS